MEITNTPENQLFNFSYEFLRQAHDIYRQYCFENDFINRCTDRLKDEIGMCNLPYSTLPDEKDILCEAYRLFCKAEDCNIPYNDTLDFVIDQIETSIEQGAVHGISPVQSPKVAIVIEDGILSAAYTTDPQIQIQIVELDKNYASSEERDLIYDTLNQDDTLQLTDYLLSIPGYQKTLGMEGNDQWQIYVWMTFIFILTNTQNAFKNFGKIWKPQSSSPLVNQMIDGSEIYCSISQ